MKIRIGWDDGNGKIYTVIILRPEKQGVFDESFIQQLYILAQSAYLHHIEILFIWKNGIECRERPEDRITKI